MFEHHVFGSQEFLTHLRGELRGWAESRARRHAMYAQQAAPTSSAATMQAIAAPRSAPPATGPTGGYVLVCYRHEQGQDVPVYAPAADIPVAAAPANTPPSGDGVSSPEAAPHVASGPASPRPEVSPPEKPTATTAPPTFSAQSVETSSPPRPSPKQAPMLDLSRPTPPPLIRTSEEKAETIERLLAQHRADMEAAEARHTTAVQGILAAAEARHKAGVQELLAGHCSDMEAAEARQTAAVQSALAEHRQSISDLIAPCLAPAAEQARPDADAHAFAQLRELLAEQAGVMKDEHGRTTGAIRDITEMIASLGETVNTFVVAVAEQKAPMFSAPPRRTQTQGDGAAQNTPRVLTPMFPRSGQSTPATAPAASRAPAPAAREHTPVHSQPAVALRDPATNTATPETTPVIHEATLATARPSQAAPASRDPAPNVGATASVTSSTPAPAVQEAAPATAEPSQPVAASHGPAPAAPSPPPPDVAPARPLTVVRDPEPIRGAPPPTVRRTTPAAAMASTPTRAGVSSLTASLMHIFASGPSVTASASPTPRQRREEAEARERDHIHDLVDDTPDEELEDVKDESEAPDA